MNLRSIVAVPLVALTIVACASPESLTGTDGDWVGTITTEGNVTTVVNESGSVWGGTARLVEEASIGVETGDDAYMFGQVRAVSGTDDHIYVVDGQVKLVRRYDADGVFIDNIGGIGQGPGEYTEPSMIEVAPDGRIFVWDRRQQRVVVFRPDGTPLETWPANGAFCCAFPIYFDAVGGANGGALWLLARGVNRETGERGLHFRAFGLDGPFGPSYELPELDEASRGIHVVNGQRVAPFAQVFLGTTAGPARFLFADPSTYRFEVRERSETVRIVEKHWEPVPVDPEHAEWQRKATVADVRRRNPGWNWDGAGMPEHHPAYSAFYAAASGEVWVLRNAPSVPASECVEDPLADADTWASTPFGRRSCWRNAYAVDVFDAGGRFLGEVDTPAGAFSYRYSLAHHIDGDRVVTAIEDEAGTIMVKRYRLVLPGER